MRSARPRSACLIKPHDHPTGKLGNYDVTSLNGTLTITSATTPTVASVVLLGNGHAALVGSGSPGVTYTIQATSDLVNWVDIGTALADETGAYSFEDVDAASFTIRFYRVALP